MVLKITSDWICGEKLKKYTKRKAWRIKIQTKTKNIYI